MSLLVAIALAGAGWIVFTIESQRNEDRAVAQIQRELGEFARLTDSDVDPRTGARFTSAESLLRLFLQRNAPGDDQLVLGFVDGRAPLGGQQSEVAARLIGDPAFSRTVTPLTRQSGDETVDTAAGEVRISSQTVQVGADSRGALVVVTLLEAGRPEQLDDALRTYAVVVLFAWATATVLAGLLSSLLLAPLRRLRRSAEHASETDLPARLPHGGDDDLAGLARAFNHVTTRLRIAFAEHRKLADDLDERLQSQLTNLRARLELLESSAPGADLTPAPLRDDVDRISRLARELTLLARCRQPGFLSVEPVDLGRLTEALLAEARARSDRTWRFDGGDSALVPMDERLITQAVLHLADNAVQHTAPGDVVALGSSYDGERAEIWVRDGGRGVRREDHERIFERFQRAPSDSDGDGFGLGLTIAAAIAEAHGGRLDLEDADPHGAVFVLSLPAASGGPVDGPGTGPRR